MKLLLAVSADGFVAKHDRDDMSWTGSTDKKIFRLLTLGSDQPLLVGRKTAEITPELPFRSRIVISNLPNQVGLLEAEAAFPEAWLIGGPTVAQSALEMGIISRALIVQVPQVLGDGIAWDVSRWPWLAVPETFIAVAEVRVWVHINRDWRPYPWPQLKS